MPTRSTSTRRPARAAASPLRIGVLALQGDFAEHIAMLAECGVEGVEVRTEAQLHAVDGLILPGGESTTIARLLIAFGLVEPLRKRIAAGMPAWGTCAGAILLAKDVPNLDRPPLAVMDISVQRNAFGRQVDSFEADLTITGVPGAPLRAIFIRAPIITRIGRGVEVLAALPDGEVVAAREGNLIATSFHPELTRDARLHELFIRVVEAARRSATD